MFLQTISSGRIKIALPGCTRDLHVPIYLLILKTNLSSRKLFLALNSNRVFVQCH